MITKTHSIDIDEENLLSLLAALEFVITIRQALVNQEIVTIKRGGGRDGHVALLVGTRVIRDNIMDQTGIEIKDDRPTIQ